MDFLTHFTSGYLIKKKLAKTKNKFYTIIFIIAAMSPDIDIIWSWNNMDLHRIFTHSLVLAPFFAWILSLIIYFIMRIFFFWKKDFLEKDFSYFKIYLISIIWVLVHLFLDYLVVWWIPLFYPFNEIYFSLNLYLYVIEPFLFLTFLILIVFLILQKFTSFKITAKKLFLLNFLFIFVFIFRFWENYYAGKISWFEKYSTIPYITETSDYFYLNRYKVISKKDWFYNIKYIDIISGKVKLEKKVRIYSWKNNCSKMHFWFLYKQWNLIWDIRYSDRLTEVWHCFWGKVK